jgi:hypothetical protein
VPCIRPQIGALIVSLSATLISLTPASDRLLPVKAGAKSASKTTAYGDSIKSLLQPN